MPPKRQAQVTAAAAPKPTELLTITITAKADIKKAKLPLTDGTVTVDAIQAHLKKKTAPEELGKYSHEGMTIFIYGYKDGKAGTENKYEFPPPYDTLLPFGDVLLIASPQASLEHPVTYTQAQWDTFFEHAMGGFDSIGSEDELEEDAENSEEEIDAVPSDVDDDEDGVASIIEEPESDEEEERPVRAETKKKKSSATVSGYQKQMNLMIAPGFKELTNQDAASKAPIREKTISFLTVLNDLKIGKGVSGASAAEELETGIYNATCAEADRRNVIKHWDNQLFNGLYQITLRTICSHLHPKSPLKNPRLLERLQQGEITLLELPSLTPQEMFPENWKELADRQAIREQKLLEGNKGMATDRYKCGRCGKRECTYYEMQTRSADEPMTIFISCLNCGKRWRQ